MDTKRAVLKPSHIAVRERRKKKRRFLVIFAVVICFVIAIAFVSHIPRINIYNFDIEGNKITNTEDIEKYIKKEIEGNYIFVFSKSNTFVISPKHLEIKLTKNFPRIEEVFISREGLHGLKIDIVERSGQYLWCGGLDTENNPLPDTSCFFTDREGYIFGTAPYFSGDAYFKFYGAETIDYMQNPISEHITDPTRFIDFIRMIEGVEKLGIKTVALKIQENGEYHLLLSKTENTQSVNPEIIFSRDNDISEILENISTALSSEFKKQFDDNRSSLLYIDLRFKDKVYYKFKELN